MDPRTEKMLAERRQPTAVSKTNGAPGLRLPAYRAAIEKWPRARWGIGVIGAVFIVATFAGGRYFFITKPALARERAAFEEMQARQEMETAFDVRQASLDECLSVTDSEHKRRLVAECRTRHWPSGCSLPRDVVEQQQRAYTDSRNDCMRRFSLNSEMQ